VPSFDLTSVHLFVWYDNPNGETRYQRWSYLMAADHGKEQAGALFRLIRNQASTTGTQAALPGSYSIRTICATRGLPS
jgi:hypothetical protein